MKKNIALVAAAAMMAGCLFTACGNGGSTTTAPTETGTEETAAVDAEETDEEDTAAIGAVERTTFTVGFDANFPPYGYLGEDGEYIGFDLDLAQEVCDRNGWELVKTPIDWDAKDTELNSGAIDCIWNGFTMNGREDAYTWSPAYIDNTQVFVVLADSGIETSADLAGKNVEVQADSSALAALTDEENQEVKELADSFALLTEIAEYETALMDLETGACDAVAMDEGVARTKMAQNENLKILDDIIATEQYGIGFKLGNTELADTVWATLLEMEADGTIDTIAETYGINPENICINE